MALYSKEIKRAQDKAKSGKSTKIITKKAEKSPKLKSTYEIAQTVKKPKKKVVNKKETVTTTNGSSTSNLAKLRNRPTAQGAATRLYSAVRSGGERHRAEQAQIKEAEAKRKERETARAARRAEVKDIPFGIRTVAGRAMLDDAGKAELAKRKARRRNVIRERSPVTTTNIPSPTEIQKLAERKAENARRKKEGRMSLEEERATDDFLTLSYEQGGKISRKKGCTVSRKKGGTVSRKAGGKVFNGNDEVSKYYDM